jgi:ABC-type phosphate/phosphonate transport system permease subunit
LKHGFCRILFTIFIYRFFKKISMLNVSEIIQTIKQLVEVRMQMVKNEISEQLSIFITRILLLVLMGVVGLFILLFLSFCLAFYLNEVTYSNYLGFLYVSLIYILLLVVIYIMRNSGRLSDSAQTSLKAFIFRVKSKVTD